MRSITKNGSAQAGVGTLIIFIAMVLVAAVAAAVLIQTSGVMQAKSTSTTKEAATTVTENIVVEGIDGITDVTKTNLVTLSITVKAASGSTGIDLSKVLLKVGTNNYNFSQAGSTSTFRVFVLRQSTSTSTSLGSQSGNYTDSANPTLETGALARLDLPVSGYIQKSKMTIALTPEKGTTLTIPVSLPAFGDTNISIYP